MTQTQGLDSVGPVGVGPAGVDWRRLDTRMLLVHPAGEVVRFLPALVGVFLIGSHSNDNAWWHVAGVAVPVVLGLLRYLTTSFRITPTQLELRRGLLNRVVLTAPLDRVRTVELTSSPIHRVLGLAKVRIGTGSAHTRGEERLELNALSLVEARTLRAALLHDAPGATPVPTASPTHDDVLLRLDPSWVRYAPLTTGGLAIGLAALAAGNQLLTPLVTDAVHRYDGSRVSVPLWAGIVGAVVVFVVVISVLSVLGYLLANWGFVLFRDASGRSFHVVKGMLTNRETSIETRRIRGVEVHEPLGLRLVGAGRLAAIVTGLSRRESSSTTLVPPAPTAAVRRVAEEVLGDGAPLKVALTGHGPAAVRRRYTRALAGGTVASGIAAIVGLALGVHGWPLLLALVVLVPVPLLAHDRARRLGHALAGAHLVIRSHSFHGRRVVLQCDGIIGWNLHQSWFQRRVGLTTLVATTAGGKQGYPLLDVPDAEALGLARAATPGLLEPFLR
ncbi:PH domain-containing protein [Nocardioides terrisoli]|uniref:PH domain-containing protein n=1 Tax=Nocardioides terrisoli TaxID=3388267 RepID=UPI00287B784B|nr:PH domain-containing protein [Nocardioides marmorisolisilvae]